MWSPRYIKTNNIFNKGTFFNETHAYFALMNTEHLQTFLEVYAAKSFAKVAKARNTAPSSVSRSIATLEKALGIRLFNRTTRRLAPTEDGDRLYLRLLPINEALEDTLSELSEAHRAPSGVLRVSASNSYGLDVIVPLLKSFREIYPDIQIDLLLSDRRVDIVGERIDVAVRHGQLNDSGLIASKLSDVSYRLVASSEYLSKMPPVKSPLDLAEHSLLTFSYEDFAESWVFRSPGKTSTVIQEINPVVQMSSALALRSCAQSGMGIAILPDWACDEKDLQTVLPEMEVTGAHFDSSLWLMVPSRAYQPKRAIAFMDALRDATRA